VAGKTNTELIRELNNTVTTLLERVDNIRGDLDDLETAHTRTADSLAHLVTRVTVLEERFADLKKAVEESDRKRWLLTVAVVGAFPALAANLALSLLRR
jgi:predicted  nucleic acid-binding Zn-ribbon protein